MSLLDKEHYDLLIQFERENHLKVADREKDKEWWKRGYVYANGETNRNFINYRNGYSLGKRIAQDEAQQRIDELEARLAELTRELHNGNA